MGTTEKIRNTLEALFRYAGKNAALKELFRENALDIAGCAHVAVDIQRAFCNARKAAHIIEDIARPLKAVGIHTHWVYMEPYNMPPKGPESAFGGMYKTDVPAGDTINPKSTFSAFSGIDFPDFNEVLKENHIKTLVVSGFDFAVCVYHTIRDARELGYNVIVLKDGTNYTAPTFNSEIMWAKARNAMQDNGVIFANSAAILKSLKKLPPPEPAPGNI